MGSFLLKIRQRTSDLIPREAFFFSRPLLILQSDDWGRAGLRDQEGFEQLRAAGVALGERPYDLYSLETAEDLKMLALLLKRHRDPSGRSPVVVMNFITANLDLPKMAAADFRELKLYPLAEGLPAGWSRPGLLEGYREGVAAGVFYPALHGTTHFCRTAMELAVRGLGERAALLRTIWQAGTPYIHWRMPWIGYEYWAPELGSDDHFLSAACQTEAIGLGVGLFSRIFSTLPRSACAPGYRANADTRRAWAQFGIHCAQNGPERLIAPYRDRNHVLQLHRTVEFEPATDPEFSLNCSVSRVAECFAAGIPAIVSLHSINFHSTVHDFRTRSLDLLDEFLSRLEAQYPEMLYVHDEDLHRLVEFGTYDAATTRTHVEVTRRRIWGSARVRRVNS
jgi:hypothetical protein